jgi:carbon storage regulator CsrA
VLILTRRPRERLFINGAEIIIEVLSYQGDKVRFAITAPEEILIDHPKKEVKPKTNIIYKLIRKTFE